MYCRIGYPVISHKYSWKPNEPCYFKNSEVRVHLKVCGAEDIHIAANQSQQVVESDSVNCVKWGPTVSSAGAARRNHSQLPALCVPIGRAPSVSAKRVIFVRSFWFRGGYQGRHNGGGGIRGGHVPQAPSLGAPKWAEDSGHQESGEYQKKETCE